TDRRTGRVWEPLGPGRVFVTRTWKAGRALALTVLNPATLREWTAFVSLEPNRPELLVTVTGEGEMPGPLEYPRPFKTRVGDRLIVPMNEGVSYPVDAPDGLPGSLVTYSGHGVCMSFFGVQDDATGAGYMGIVETADDAAVQFHTPAGGTAAAGVRWDDQKGRFGYARRVRFVFFKAGGYVAMCKRYRAYAKSQGLLKTFAEKAKERPLVDRLLGAPNIWCWDGDKIGMANKLKAAGIDRFLWSAGGDAKQIAALAKMEGVLVSRYDVYRDIYRPEQLKKLGWKSGTNTDAWPEGAAWNSADSNDWRKAWGVKAKDGTWTYCGCMCDAVSAKYCRLHVGKELQTHRYNTRFIDVTTAAAWDTCSNPAHPMTRGESRAYRMDLLRLLGDEFGLVVGSETGHDAAVPYCDYFEGMLSLCNYRVPDSGRNIGEVWTNVPPRVAQFQVGAAYRLPLWELVYHDCLCAHWYWGDYNNKLPALWDRRDLFNVLYGTMGMYLFTARQWEQDKDRFVRSYRITSPVARRTGYSEMLDHRILTPDRLVQRSTFADGTVVTVNFGATPFTLPEGGTLAPGGYKVSP
ncbi:MAG: glycoside hydrolase, partial [Kiritimatiellia bacterium]